MKTEKTSFHHSRIETPAQFARTLNAGPYAWPGGYPLVFITHDCEVLSFDSARENARQVCASIREQANDGWRVVGCEVNWEDAELYCAHSGKRIESAYAADAKQRAEQEAQEAAREIAERTYWAERDTVTV